MDKGVTAVHCVHVWTCPDFQQKWVNILQWLVSVLNLLP